MKLLFIYGPPASGKLTIAEKLSEITGIPLFHNHLSRDIVKDIYKKDLDKHYSLVDQLRFDVIGYCAKENTDLIFTYVYEGAADDENIHQYMELVKKHNGEIVFIELTADREDLISRVSNESRRKFKKLSNPELMTQLTEDMSIFTIPFVQSLKINTSKMSPEQSALYISRELRLSVKLQQ
jgi:adenylate kinase family enzyme